MALEASRHLCQEARVVLTSLRGGPPMVARGDLAQDLIDLRSLVKSTLSKESSWQGHDSSASISFANDSSQAKSSPLKFEPATNLDPPPPVDVGPYARPFLAIVMDPRAAGPHTLVALRSLHRLLQRKSLMVATEGGIAPFVMEDTNSQEDSEARQKTPNPFRVALEPLTKGILHCKFEQTDAGADEAVEMAIADLLSLIVKIDRRSLQPETLMDSFNTVFVTRNTFVHSPALCYHFEDVLMSMCKSVFGDLDSLRDTAGRLILEFLVNQLLHTPLVGGQDEASREAQLAHDATRVLCLRLTRAALRHGIEEAYWTNSDLIDASNTIDSTKHATPQEEDDERSILQIVQDDLCLSLLMTGQAIWAYQENGVATGFVSLEVLSEICSTLSLLWTITSLRKHLVSQFEAIFSGFYQRALVLLRKRWNPTDGATFHSNLYFDAGVEIILESLVDIMTLHDHRHTVAEGNGGSLETLFAFFDCNVKRSDIAVDLMVDLCRCTGSKVDEEGEILDTSFHGDLAPHRPKQPETPSEGTDVPNPPATPGGEIPAEGTTAEGYRVVPPHLRELCAEAIIGGMKCMFMDDHPSEETRKERNNRLSILAGKVSPAPQSWSDLNRVTSSHHMRNIKSKKRLMRKAAQLFNKKSSKGIEFLVTSGVVKEPVTPRAVASFLRNAIVVGLDKRAVGAYLGEMGKSPEAGKSPPVWTRDFFHKEVLETYCSLFRFERQSLLDGLRMFLAAFRLPGEAQQIDRILQAFSDSCSRVCDEGAHGSLKLFSEDPKRASDAAYLLSFSIIMLNTDQHNDNIREDRKMSKADFVKNNSDYGRDITEKGKELPKEYLEAIYDSIREEEIRTEGEGADGSMTVERWKDVLRGSADDDGGTDDLPSVHDAEDVTELVLEHLWMPIMSSISALWGVKPSGEASDPVMPEAPEVGTAGMLGAQGARLGMDLAWEMLIGVRQLGRNDIFSKIFNCVCKYGQLLTYKADEATRTWSFAHSVESQSALVVALRVAREATDEIGIEGWKRIWLMLFELRDLKLLGGGVSNRRKSIMMETESDLLKQAKRQEWNRKLLQRGIQVERDEKKSSGVSIFGAVGRALFGSGEVEDPGESTRRGRFNEVVKTIHGKEDQVLWDELAGSDDEDEGSGMSDDEGGVYTIHGDSEVTLGAQFESLLIQEDLLLNQQREMPVTGLERVEDSQLLQLSQRARVRKRLSKSCDYAGLVSESRFMDNDGIGNVLQALMSLIPVDSPIKPGVDEGEGDSGSNGVGNFVANISQFPVSPASEAFAEVLIAEIAIRNRDRLANLWHSHLQSHYLTRLENIIDTYVETEEEPFSLITSAMEKSLTGMLRICCCAVQRGGICNEILKLWTMLRKIKGEEGRKPLLCSFDYHLSEGLWRITRAIDETSNLGESGWEGLLALADWCAHRGCSLPPVLDTENGETVGLVEDDPALLAYRAVHFMINVSEVKDKVPLEVVNLVRTLVAAGELRGCPKLSVAGLDLLHSLCIGVESTAVSFYREERSEIEKSSYWKTNWMPVLECMAEACHASSVSAVRQHALSMLTDSFLENQGGLLPFEHLCDALGKLCIPMAGRRIVELREQAATALSVDDSVIEIDLCVGLIFKPLRHHIQSLTSQGTDCFLSVWSPILNILKPIFSDQSKNDADSVKAYNSSRELTLEHFQNVVMVLKSNNVLSADPDNSDAISSKTWLAISEMDFCKSHLAEWQKADGATL